MNRDRTRSLVDLLDAMEGTVRAAGQWDRLVASMHAKGYFITSSRQLTRLVDDIRDELREKAK